MRVCVLLRASVGVCICLSVPLACRLSLCLVDQASPPRLPVTPPLFFDFPPHLRRRALPQPPAVPADLMLYDASKVAADLARLPPVSHYEPDEHIHPDFATSVHLVQQSHVRMRAKVLVAAGQRVSDRDSTSLPADFDLDNPADYRRHMKQLDAHEHPCEAIVLAVLSCGRDGCQCDFPEPKPSRAVMARHATQLRRHLRDQACKLPLVAVVPPRSIVTPAERVAMEKLSQRRRVDRQLFHNVGALVFDTCCCCYRYVQQHVDKLGNKQTAANKIKGRKMSEQADIKRLQSLMPDVMFDLLRKYNKQHGTVHSHMPTALRQSLWICDSCHSHFNKTRWKTVPAVCMQNDLLLGDVPPALANLTQYERHLVARVRTFHQLVYLPFGQTAARGLCISYPSETNELVDSLPSTLADSDVVIVRQAQDNSSDTKPITEQQHGDMKKAEEAAAIDAAVESANPSPAIAYKPKPRQRKTPVQFQVRPNYVKKALEWLKGDNELYRSIRIETHLDDEEVDPESQAILDDVVETKSESTAASNVHVDPDATQPDASPPPEDDRRLLIDHVAVTDPVPMNETKSMHARLLRVGETRNDARIPIMQIQRASGRPILINYQRACEAMAYPGIFPHGVNHFGTHRALRLTPKQYFRSRFLAYRERCIKDPTYLFFVTNALDWYELEQQVGIRFRMWQKSGNGGRSAALMSLSDPDLHSRDGVLPLTRADLEEHAKAIVKPGEENFVDQTCFTFMQSMRGTLAYWNKCKRDLFSMLAMLGPPTWFVTFSADEFGWLECLMSAGGLTREQASVLTQKEKEDLIANNPDLVSRYFDHRWSSFFRLILKSKTGSPIGVITDHFWRVEFQRRGSPHVHMLLWVEGAPVVEENMTEVDKVTVAQWVSRYVSTEIPKEPGELRDLVLRLQQHAHTPTCTRTKKGTVNHCRFHFPRPVCEATRFVTPQDKGLPKRTIYVTKRDAEDVHTNAYNPELLLAWRGNMDIQYIRSVHGVVAYVCAYMTKDEPEGFRASMQAALSSLPPTADKRQQMMRMGSTILSKRELPAQEACYKLFGLKLRDASRTFVRIDARPPGVRTRVLKSHWQQESDDSTDLFHSSVIERYKMRPQNRAGPAGNNSDDSLVDWDKMTLTHFASNYTMLSAAKTPRAADDDLEVDDTEAETGQSYQLSNGRTWIRKTRKQLCIQTNGLSADKDGQVYYYSVLMLHVPFRNEADLLICDGVECSPMQAFISRSSEFVFGERSIASHREFAAEIERTVTQLQVLKQGGTLDMYAGIQLASDIAGRSSEMRSSADRDRVHALAEKVDATGLGPGRDEFLDDGGRALQLLEESQRLNALESPYGDLRESFDDRVTVNPNAAVTLEQHTLNATTLNAQQRAVYDRVVQHTGALFGADLSGDTDPTVEPLRMFISGGGGTGKSYVLSAIRDHIMRVSRNRGCMVCAPTGVAAFHVQGRTLHGAFGIPVDQKGRTPVVAPLTGDLEQEKLALFQHVHYLVIDEISMVSDNMMAKISSRLNQIMLRLGRPIRPHTTFGGISIISIGDLYQLKPVMDTYIFNQHSPSGRQLWGEFQLSELMANERQANDPVWCALLNRIRVGDHSNAVADFRLLRQRLTVTGCAFNVVQNPIDDTQDPWATALRIFCTNKLCHAYNKRKTDELALTTAVYQITAEHAMMNGQRSGNLGVNIHTVPASWLPDSDDDCGGLTHILHLGVGSRVMLRRNIAIGDGLVNGAAGTVVSFEWAGDRDAPLTVGELPSAVMVLFDNTRVGRIQNGQQHQAAGAHLPVRIEPKFSRFDGVGGSGKRQLQRKQMPLMLCWAATVHKVQGLTMDRAVIDLAGIFSAGMAYVALSRVRSLEGVALSSFPKSYARVAWCEPEVVAAFKRLRLTMHILPPLPLTPRPVKVKSVARKHKSTSWQVEAVVGKRFAAGGQTEYCIKWIGYADSDNTWEPMSHLTHCKEFVQTFNQRLKSAGLTVGREPLEDIQSPGPRARNRSRRTI